MKVIGRSLFGAALCLFSCPLAASAGIILDFDAGAHGLNWRPEGRGGLRFKTEGLNAYDFDAGVSLSTHSRRGTFLLFQYKAPFVRTARQNEMLAVSEAHSSGLEKYSFGVALDPLIYAIRPSLAENLFFRIAMSLEFNYSRSMYYGDAIALNDFYYVGSGATTGIVSGQNVIYGAKFVPSGQTTTFRTIFEETETTVALYTRTDKMHAFRVGRFSTTWQRPSAFNSTIRIVNNGTRYPAIIDTKYRVSGIVAKWISTDMFSEGFNADISLKFDPHPEIQQPVPLFLPKGGQLSYLDFKLGGCYNWYPSSAKGGFFIGVGADWRGMGISYEAEQDPSNPNANTSGGRIDSDILYSIYGRVGYRFNFAQAVRTPHPNREKERRLKQGRKRWTGK